MAKIYVQAIAKHEDCPFAVGERGYLEQELFTDLYSIGIVGPVPEPETKAKSEPAAAPKRKMFGRTPKKTR